MIKRRNTLILFVVPPSGGMPCRLRPKPVLRTSFFKAVWLVTYNLIFLVGFTVAVNGLPYVATAQNQTSGPDIVVNDPAIASYLWTLSLNPKTPNDLEMLNDQRKQLNGHFRDYPEREREVYLRHSAIMQEIASRDSSGEELAAANRRMNTDLEKFYQTEVKASEKILLPHQMDRVRQHILQQRSVRSTQDNFSLPLDLATALNLSDDEKDQLEKAVKKAREKYELGLDKARSDALDSVMRSLLSAQRAKLEELIGEPIPPEIFLGLR